MHLVEAANEELSKPAPAIRKTRLQSLLELAIKTSSVSADPHADNLVLELDPRSLMELVKASEVIPRQADGSKVRGLVLGAGFHLHVSIQV